MTCVWDIKLFVVANGYRVGITGGGRSVTGKGHTPYRAYRDAENKLLVKPGFFIPEETAMPAVLCE